MKTLKKYLSCLMAVMLILSSVCGTAITAYAADLVSGDYSYVVVNNSYAQITGYNGSAETVTIPSTLGNYTVKSIGENAFLDNETITSVTIPSTVTEICDFAFQYCYELQEINIPSGVTTIGKGAFADCKSLMEISVDSKNNYFKFSNMLLSLDGKRLLWYPIEGTASIPTTVEVICEYAFMACKFATITLPTSLKTIESNAFYQCQNMSSIKIPANVTSIQDLAFFGCTGLSQFTVVTSNKNFSAIDDVLYTKDGKKIICYPTMKANDSYTVQSGVTTVADGAFANASLLTEVILPSTVTYLGDKAFYCCARLKSVNLSDSITKIGDETFSQCNYLKNINLPTNLTTIGKKAFVFCESLETIDLPSKLTLIDAYAFYYCKALKSITIPSSTTRIEEGAFQCCTGLTSLTMNQGLKVIGKESFAANTSLKSVSIPDGVTTIEAKAFNYCTQLANAYIYDTVKSIGNEAFGSCNNIKIHCIKNSAAHTYAVDNSLSCEFFVTTPQITATEGVGTKSVKITWSKGRGADGYVIMRSDSENVEGQEIGEVNSGTTLTYTDNNTIPNTNRYYTVKAYCINTDNSRVYSDVSSVVAGKAAIPTPKITSATSNGVTSITLKWSKIDNVDGYYIYRTTKDGSWSSTLIATVDGGDITSYTDTSIVTGTQYYYTMRAFANVGGTIYSSSYEKVGTAGKAEIPVPTIKTKATGFTSISLSWDEVDCADGYYIYRTTTDGKWSSTLIATVVGGDTTSYTDSSVAYGTQYYYSMRAYISLNGTIYKSDYNKAGTAGKSAAVAPTFTVASAKYNSVKLSWNKISGASGYYIYRTTNSDNTGWKLIKTITSGSTVTYTDSTCTCGTTYYYTIRSYRTVNGSAVKSSYLKYGKACKPIPSTPKVTAVQQSNKSVVIKWNKIAGTTKYRIYRRTVGGSWTVVKDITNINTLTYTDKPANTTTQYEYTVKAYCGSVAGKYKAVLMTMYTA